MVRLTGRPAVVRTQTGKPASGLDSREEPAHAAAPMASFMPAKVCSSIMFVRLVSLPGPCRSAAQQISGFRDPFLGLPDTMSEISAA